MDRTGLREFGRLIRSDSEYEQVVAEIGRLLDAHPEPDAGIEERIEFLSLLVADYDRKHYDLPGPELTPQQVVEFMMAIHDIDKASLADAMGGRSRVSEFLGGKRPLSISQVQALRELLNIPADILLPEAPRSGRANKKAPAAAKAPRVLISRVREAEPTHTFYRGNVNVRGTNETSAKRAAVHVVPAPAKRGMFVIEVRGKVLTKPANKSASLARATEIARQHKTSVAIHTSSGRITTKHVGRDPKPPRDRRR